MNLNFLFQAIIILVACLNVGAAATNSPIRKNFVKFAVLSDDEFDLVVKFAKSRGMTNIAEVSTFDYIPGNKYHGILVTSTEKVDGRKISFHTLSIFREGWYWKAKPPNSSNVISMGKFWVEGLASWPEVHQLTTFPTSKGIIRVSVEGEIPIATADKIINAFTTGKIQYFDILKEEPTVADFSRPKRLFKIDGKEGHYWISFSGSLDEFEFILSDDGVKILSIAHVQI